MLKLLLLIVASTLGVAWAMPSPYILYGTTATQGQFPFIGWLGACSASILNSRTILTAAHCVCGSRPTSILLGAVHSRNPEAGSQRHRLEPSRQVVHPSYTKCGAVGKDDLAILKTIEPISFTNEVDLIVLYNDYYLGETYTFAGYGLDERSESGVLKYARSRVGSCTGGFSGAICHQMSPSSPYHGDYGGPLFRTATGGQHFLVGVASGVDFATNQAIYSKVFENLSFIRPNMLD